MSYTLPPSVTKAGAPTVNDDSTKGYVVGSSIIDTTASPRAVYFCTNPASGAAVWAISVLDSSGLVLGNYTIIAWP